MHTWHFHLQSFPLHGFSFVLIAALINRILSSQQSEP